MASFANVLIPDVRNGWICFVRAFEYHEELDRGEIEYMLQSLRGRNAWYLSEYDVYRPNVMRI